MIRIITDSTSDISQKIAKEINVDVVPLKVMFTDKSFEDGIDINTTEFYEKLVNSQNLPTTSQPSPEAFVKIFEEVKANNDEAIVILLSSKISGTYQSANIAKDIVEYDNIHIIDSLNATIGLTILVDIATRLREQGKTAVEIVEQINDYIPRTKILAVVDTLDYFLKGGRLSKTAAITGKMLNLKPIVTLVDGSLIVASKSRGLKKSFHWMSNQIITKYDLDVDAPIYFGYTGEPTNIQDFEKTMKDDLSIQNIDIKTYPIGSVIGTHAGPGARAIGFVTKE